MNADLKDFYLNTPIGRFEHAELKIECIPEETMAKCNLCDLVHDGHVYIERRKGMHGLPQAGCLANDLLKKQILSNGYYQYDHTRACKGISPI